VVAAAPTGLVGGTSPEQQVKGVFDEGPVAAAPTSLVGGTSLEQQGFVVAAPTSLVGGTSPEQQANLAEVKEASDRLDVSLALEAGSEAGFDSGAMQAEGLEVAAANVPVLDVKVKKVQWCDLDDEDLNELEVPATTAKKKQNKNKAARSRRRQGDLRDAAMLELADEVCDSLCAGRLERDEVIDAVRRGGSGLGMSEAEVRAVAAVAVQSPTR